MRKLSLQIHELKVDSFPVEPPAESVRGTVRGNQPIQSFDSGCATFLCNDTDTCVIWCQPGSFVTCGETSCGSTCARTCRDSCATCVDPPGVCV